ncbi:reverse transcriptase domain-containing protein [Tanacetum coccineum]
MTLESGKLNHLIKDVRQRGRGNTKGRDAGKDKVINMIRSWPNDRKRKSVKRDKSWMKAPIVFPPLSMKDASNEPLIIEVVMEGYLVRRIDLVGFAGGVVKPLGKIEMEVVFDDEGLFRTVMIKGGNAIRIRSGGNGGRKCRIASRKKGRLQRYFEAHPIKVITDQPLKQILNKAQASGKLAKYSVELGAYNIGFACKKDEGSKHRRKGGLEAGGEPTTSSGRSTWDLAECTSEQDNTVVAHPQANGLVDRANKSLMEGIKARLGRERAGWADMLPNVLWAHRTFLKQSNGETSFSLTYRSEAVIPTEIGMPTHRTMMIREDENEDELRLNMDLLQERREAATIREAKMKPAGWRTKASWVRSGKDPIGLELPQELSRVHHTFHVSNLKKCYANEPLVMPLEGIHVDDKLQFVEEPVEIMEREIKRLKRSRIPLVKVRWNSRRGPEFT